MPDTYINSELSAEFAQRALYGTVYTTGTGEDAGTEPTGGAPAFARKLLDWSDPDANSVVTATAVFDVPAGTDIIASGLHDALTGGRFIKGKANATKSVLEQSKVTVVYTYTQV